MTYELFYLVGASKEADLDKIKSDVSEIVTSEGGVFAEKQVVEKRKLAYEVKHEKYGFYVAQRFSLEDLEKFKSLNKRLNLFAGILRFLISRAEELPELVSRKEREEKATAAKELKKETIAKETKEIKAVAKPAEEPLAEQALAGQAVQPEKVEAAAPEKVAKETEEDIDKKLEEILNI
jgi:ribosomal protein S6